MCSNFIEINYDAGRTSDTFKRGNVDYNEYLPLTGIIAINISQRYRYIESLFGEICKSHKNLVQIYSDRNRILAGELGFEYGGPDLNLCPTDPMLNFKYQYKVEEFVWQIRRILDALVLGVSTKIRAGSKFGDTRPQFSGISGLLREDGPNYDEFEILLGSSSLQEVDTTGFLKLINDLFNAYKHHLINEEITSRVAFDAPVILAYYQKNNSPESPIQFHNHSAYHVMMGFQDMFKFMTSNIVNNMPDS